MEEKQNVVSKKENEDDEDEERKHFCKVISTFRFYRFVQLGFCELRSFASLFVGGRGRLTPKPAVRSVTLNLANFSEVAK